MYEKFIIKIQTIFIISKIILFNGNIDFIDNKKILKFSATMI